LISILELPDLFYVYNYVYNMEYIITDGFFVAY